MKDNEYSKMQRSVYISGTSNHSEHNASDEY